MRRMCRVVVNSLPVCFDGIKAHALCERVAERTGGTVLPTFFYGTGGGHVGYKWTLIPPEEKIAPLIEATLDHLAKQGFKVVVLLTGHYPREQVSMVHRLAEEAEKRHSPSTLYRFDRTRDHLPRARRHSVGRSRGQI